MKPFDDSNPKATTTLAAALRQVAADLRSQQPPPALRQRVLDAARLARAARAGGAAAGAAPSAPPRAVDARLSAGAPPAAAPPRRWGWAAGAACGAVLAGSALLMLRTPMPAAEDERPRIAGGFVPVAEPDRWPRDAAPAWLVATELSGERLAALGLPYDPAQAGATVRAELLLRESGEVLAVRLLP